MQKWKQISVAALLAAGSAQAALVAYDDFDYGVGVNLTTDANNLGIGWVNDWNTTIGGGGLTTSGAEKSLYFGQSPDLTTDGSTHLWSESSKGNERDFNTAIDLATKPLYFTLLFRTYGAGAAGVVDMRAQFYDGLSSTGNMRANVGISDGSLFVNGNTAGYLAAGSSIKSGAVADDTTYLLAMKRTGTHIYASLITADGNASTLASEPAIWDVSLAQNSGVDLTALNLYMAGSAGMGIRADELRIATDWNSAVGGMVIPEPATLGMVAAFGAGIMFIRRRLMM